MAVWYSNLKRKNFIERIKVPIFLKGVLAIEIMYEPQSNIEEKVNPRILKADFLINNRPIHFHINSTSIFRLVKWNYLSFFNIETSKPLPAPVYSVL